MMYSKKAKLDRRNAIMVAVKKELKVHNAFITSEQLKEIADALDTSKYYHIEVIRDVEEAAKRLRIMNHETRHSWAGDMGEQEKAEITFGTVTLGEDYFYEYFDNGNSNGPTEYITEPEFDTNAPYALMINKHDWRDYNNDCCNHDDWYDTIVIYTPQSIIDEEKYTAMKEAELNRLCDLTA